MISNERRLSKKPDGSSRRKRAVKEFDLVNISVASEAKFVEQNSPPAYEGKRFEAPLGEIPEEGEPEEVIRSKSRDFRESIRASATFWGGVAEGFRQWIRSKDLYGQPVTFNYQGQETYKTCPGGCLSLMFLVTLFCFFVLKFKNMVLREDWQLIQQEVMAEISDLSTTHTFGSPSYSNITLALQFNKKKPKQTVADQLSALGEIDEDRSPPGGRRALEAHAEESAILASNYLKIVQMVEYRNGTTYDVYDKNVNADLYSWKEQASKTLIPNDHSLLELRFDLSEATIQGTRNHLSPMEVVVSRFQVRFDKEKMKADALQLCLARPECSSQLSDSKPALLSNIFDWTFEGYDDKSSAQRADAQRMFEYMSELAASDDEADYLKFMESYYFTYIPLRAGKYFSEFKTKILALEEGIAGNITDNLLKAEFIELSEQNYRSRFRDLGEMYEAYNATLWAEVIALWEEFQFYSDKEDAFEEIITEHEASIDQALSLFDIELVLYDEVENFRESTDPLFDYPFQRRKTKLQAVTMTTGDIDANTGNYDFYLESIKFESSLACLEAGVFDQLSFFSTLVNDIYLFARGLVSPKEASTLSSKSGIDKCEGASSFLKLKYSNHNSLEQWYLNDYEKGVITGKILIEVQMEMNPFKTESIRTTTQILDFLGDVGGFYEILDISSYLIASFFSGRFFLASIASTLYRLKDSAKSELLKGFKRGLVVLIADRQKSAFGEQFDQIQDKSCSHGKFSESETRTYLEQLNSSYSPILLNPAELVLDPLKKKLARCFKICIKSKTRSFEARERVLEKCQEKFTSELDIVSLLSKLREVHEMMSYLKTSEQALAMEFHRDRTIQLTDPDSGSSSDSGDEENQKSTSAPAVDLNPAHIPPDLKAAFDYSIVRGSSLSDKSQMKLMNLMATPPEMSHAGFPESIPPSLLSSRRPSISKANDAVIDITFDHAPKPQPAQIERGRQPLHHQASKHQEESKDSLQIYHSSAVSTTRDHKEPSPRKKRKLRKKRKRVLEEEDEEDQ